MNVAIFGGTFDPIHRGHIAVARAAADRFRLKKVYFVPAYIPPHKRNQSLSSFGHRYTMTALATADDPRFVPSMLESSDTVERSGANISYSVDTVRRLKRELGEKDRLFFILGIDAFLDIAKWREPVELLRQCEFIIASRPGFSLADAVRALPESVRPPEDAIRAALKLGVSKSLVLPGATLHMLEDVHEGVSSTKARQAAAAKSATLKKLVGEPVAGYIRKLHLYEAAAPVQNGPRRSQDGLHLVSAPDQQQRNKERSEPE